jgi:GntP family gluconate:H+ symporter
MGAGVIAAVIGLIFTVYVLLPLMPSSKAAVLDYDNDETSDDQKLPSFLASMAGPLASIILLALRPLCDVVIDPMIALPIGGLVTILATGSWKDTAQSLSFGLEKMTGVAILLIGTGAIAGIIKASEIKDVFIALLSGWEAGGVLMAPISGALMSAARASTTAGATIASASFSQTVLASGVSAVWAAAMTNAGATILDHLPHGSFFHATGGSVGMSIKERMRLIPYESAVGLILTAMSLVSYLIAG